MESYVLPRGAGTAGLPAGRALLLAGLLVAGAFAVVLAGVQSPLFDLERHTVAKELALDLTALAALAVLLPGRHELRAGVVGTLLAAFVAWSALSALLATNHWIALHAFGVSFSGMVIYFAGRRVAAAGLGRVVLVGFVAAVVLGALAGIAQAYGLDWRMLADSRPPGGTFGNRNFLAHLTVIAMPALLVLALRARRRGGAVAGLVGLAIGGAAIVLTRSRAAWLAFAVTMVVLGLVVLLARGRPLAGVPRRRVQAVGLVLTLAVLAAVFLPNQLNWRSGSPYAETLTRLTDFREGSGRGRIIQYRNSLRLLAHDPVFGAGPGNWFVQYPLVTTPGDPSFAGYDPIPTNPWPSSDWVAFAVNRGVVGVLLLALAGLGAALTAVRRIPGPDTDVALDALILLGTITGAATTGLFDAVLLLAAPSYYVLGTIGLLLPATGALVSRPLAGRSRSLALGGTAALAGLLTLTSAGQLAAILMAGNGASRAALERALHFDPGSYRLHLLLMRRGSCAERLPHARAAARLMPYHQAPRDALAACGQRSAPDQ